jgi:hypothetical protein
VIAHKAPSFAHPPRRTRSGDAQARPNPLPQARKRARSSTIPPPKCADSEASDRFRVS